MTKNEAIDFMRDNEGVKITHYHFAPEEYIYMKNGVIYTEENYIFEDFYSTSHNGMRMRSGYCWQNGWKEYEG